MRDLDKTARLVRWGLGVALLPALLVGLTACAWLFNKLPTAAFTASATTGQAPLTVNFSAVLSSDPDGTITDFEWDFGDGANATGETASHTYTTAGSFTVVLRITDNDGAQATAQKTINVLPGEPAGPAARFTASPTSGTSPLSVQFNASGSTYDQTPLGYSWSFGDGGVGVGLTASHLYVTSTTRTYTVTLTVRGPDGKEGTVTGTIAVTGGGGGGGGTTGNTPSARFTATPTDGTAPLTVDFDPSDSEAASGRTLVTYTWSFGDLGALTTNTPTAVTHEYRTTQESQLFSATLIVIDDLGKVGTTTKTIRARNRQPVAGFEIQDALGWQSDDVTIHTLLGVQTVSVRSEHPDGTYWHGGAGTPPNTGSTVPSLPYIADDKNLSYDPEGQFTAQGWGIVTYVWNWGDGTGLQYVTADAFGGCPVTAHPYDLGGAQQKTWTVQVEVYDALGARKTLSRQVTLTKT